MPVNTYILVVTNPDAEAGNTIGWTSNGGFNVRTSSPAPYSGSYYFIGGTGVVSSFARQDIDILDSFANTGIDQNTAVANISWWQAGAVGDNDLGAIQLRFMNGSTFLSNTTVSQIDIADNTWQYRSIDALVPYGTRKVRIEIVSTRVNGTEINAYYDNISNVIINTGFANVNVTSVYAEVVGEYAPINNVQVSSVSAEVIGEYAPTNNVQVISVSAETLGDITTANANVYQFYAEVIVGAVLPRVLVAGGA